MEPRRSCTELRSLCVLLQTRHISVRSQFGNAPHHNNTLDPHLFPAQQPEINKCHAMPTHPSTTTHCQSRCASNCDGLFLLSWMHKKMVQPVKSASFPAGTSVEAGGLISAMLSMRNGARDLSATILIFLLLATYLLHSIAEMSWRD